MILLSDATVHIGTSSSYRIPLPSNERFSLMSASSLQCAPPPASVSPSAGRFSACSFPFGRAVGLNSITNIPRRATSAKLSRLGVTRVHRRKSAFALSRHVTKSRVTSDDVPEEVPAVEAYEPESRIFDKFSVEIK